MLHAIDMYYQTPWDDKALYFIYVDLAMDFAKLFAYSFLFVVLIHFYGVPLHILRDVYITLRSFVDRVKHLVRYRQATANMQTRYPTATFDELEATDKVCIVCREDMAVSDLDNEVPDQEVAKKLPCGHIFHFRCLKSWLERQQACPTCRRSVLDRKILD